MNKTQTATFGGGCFWCTEAVFQEVEGVLNVVSGYSGGTVPGIPTYREICSGLTGHAEVVQLTYDPTVVSYETLVLIFMTTHNPTTLNQQGADRGTQYRSVIFYEDEQQAEIAKKMLLHVAPYYSDTIVTEVSPLKEFFEAEPEHQNFYLENQEAQYCTYVINPKLAKLRQLHADKLKK